MYLELVEKLFIKLKERIIYKRRRNKLIINVREKKEGEKCGGKSVGGRVTFYNFLSDRISFQAMLQFDREQRFFWGWERKILCINHA